MYSIPQDPCAKKAKNQQVVGIAAAKSEMEKRKKGLDFSCASIYLPSLEGCVA